MKVSIYWLKELVDLKVSIEALVKLIPLRTIGLKDVTNDFIELDMKAYNRADLLSLRGVAREVTAITNSKITFADEIIQKFDLPKTKVSVEDSNLCPVYCIAKIEGLKSASSNPDWVKKLESSSMRPVNNIADVTNLIMLEYGQPMHSFDADKVKAETLVVRTAAKGETLRTLDDKIRNLDQSDLLIADPEKPLGIAGVMGGKDSEASDSPNTILLEAAIFNPVSIKKTTQRHVLYSEASKRFQHGLTKTNLLQALSSAIKMYEGLGGKLTALTLTGNLGDEQKTIQLNQEKVNSLIGIEIPQEKIEQSLRSLGFSPKRAGANVIHLEGGLAWHVQVPYWRLDINIEEDLIEEIARMYGYEKIPAEELPGELPEKIDQSLPNLIYDLKKSLVDNGLTEVQTYSFYSSQTIENCKFRNENLVKVANPISSETEYMRNYLWPNLVEVIAKNLKQGFKDIAIFEIGKVYNPKNGDLPEEIYHLSIALMNGTENPIQELSVIANEVKQSLSLNRKIATVATLPRNDTPFHPTRKTDNMAEVHPRILNKFGIDKRVAIMEIEIN